MDLLGGGGAGGGGGGGGGGGWIYWDGFTWPDGVQRGAIFHDKAKIIRDKMSNLSNNMMINEL
jgi:hypothetical protein